MDASRSLAERAARRIAEGALNDRGVEDLAASLHVGPRQLRRAVKREFGATPVQLAQTHRLLLAKRLLAESDLSMTEVAFASGFSSLRRFNALFRERYRMSPSRLRRNGRRTGASGGGRSDAGAGPNGQPTPGPPGAAAPGAGAGEAPAAPLRLTLEYRPPYDWDSLLDFLEARAIPGLERVDRSVAEGRYLRTLSVAEHGGWFAARPAAGGAPALAVEVSLSLLPVLPAVLERVRRLFDLDAEPGAVASHLERDPILRSRVRKCPGLRVPGAADGFELGWRAVLGQQVSVAAARTLAGRFAETFGEAASASSELPDGLVRFPVPAASVANAAVDRIAALGITTSRAACIRDLAAASAEGSVSLEPGGDPGGAIERLERLRGIGPWTAGYIALRALHWPDAFPDGDLVLRQRMGRISAAELRRRSEAWRPWRAYAALHLWREPEAGPLPTPHDSKVPEAP